MVNVSLIIIKHSQQIWLLQFNRKLKNVYQIISKWIPNLGDIDGYDAKEIVSLILLRFWAIVDNIWSI